MTTSERRNERPAWLTCALLEEASQDGVWAIDEGGRLTYVTAAGATLLGYAPEEMLGQHALDFVDANWRQPGAGAMEDLRRGRPRRQEMCLVNHAGEAVWVEFSAAPSFDADGQFEGATAIVRDISAVKWAEHERRKLRGWLDAAFENLPFDFWVTDRDGRYVFQNGTSIAHWGDHRGRNPRQSNLPPAVVAEFDRNNRRALAGEVVRTETSYVRSGERRTFEKMIAPIRDGSEVVGILGINIDITERKRATDALRESEAKYRTLVDNVHMGIGILQDGELAYVNASMRRILGRQERSVTLGDLVGIAHPADRHLLEALLSSAPESERGACRLVVDDEIRWVRIRRVPILYDGREAFLVLVEDETERRSLQNQLNQAQRLEAVGRLAGGIAHDFNNLLTAILSCATLAESRLEQARPIDRELDTILTAGQRAAELTRQLLTFARRERVEPTLVRVDELVRRSDGLIRPLIGEGIELRLDLEGRQLGARVDPVQFEQALLNLVVNAKNAMPDGGTLGLRTEHRWVDEPLPASGSEIEPGDYAVITVEDTGVGMDEDTLSHIFEPFFTTRRHSGGTGLGLASVYGIVRQAGGHITVTSEPGGGTVFHLWLPAAHGASEPTLTAPRSRATRPHQPAVVMVVEDEPAVMRVVAETLEEVGHLVLRASSAAEAEYELQHLDTELDVLLTDVVMPGGSGIDLAERLTERQPSLRVLLMSGYADDRFRDRPSAERFAFIQKPFTPEVLRGRVQALLDEGDADDAARSS